MREGSTVGLRVDGSLREVEFVTSSEFIREGLQQTMPERLWPVYQETGDADYGFEEESVGRFRVNLHRQRGLMSLALRHVKERVPSVGELGLPEIILRIAESERGIVFVTGTTGSGKSTTLACMIEHLNQNMNRHLITIEDPIEYAFRDNQCIIEQREVGLDAVSFESAVIHTLRQDPDVIVIGEMRDTVTFETALQAAETGHLVLTTLHTQTAAQSINRILDMYPADERDSVRIVLSGMLRGIICQRLIPKAMGSGVVPATEIMINSPIMRKLIAENRIGRLDAAIENGREAGMMTFNQCLLGLVNDGVITEEAAMAASNNPQALEMNLNGIFLNTDSGSIIGER
jgi:twitching motility protein PilT